MRSALRCLRGWSGWILGLAVGWAAIEAQAQLEDVRIDDVPDYEWHVGCFGTATGNLMGFWDRNGFADFYTGPTGGGIAPLNSRSSQGNQGIFSLWASKAGRDGRPADLPGHEDDYYFAYESVFTDPYLTAGRKEHAPDCLGDFIGLSQNKWADLGGECRGNIDGFSYVHWNKAGDRRLARPGLEPEIPAASDIPSGLVSWTRYRGGDAVSFCQLTDFNPTLSGGRGFSYADLKAEIRAGRPVLLFMQPAGETSRTVSGVSGVNPDIHGMLAYGYWVDNDGTEYVRYRTSWASGDQMLSPWTAAPWLPGTLGFPLRGVIAYQPLPKIRSIRRDGAEVVIIWDGSVAKVRDGVTGERGQAQRFVVEQATAPDAAVWTAVSDPLEAREFRGAAPSGGNAFYRIRSVPVL
ncbi:MAG: hypothetical protein RLZ45_1546 [Verrucomicrobiota bacterium]|jgi:hypothetical protein